MEVQFRRFDAAAVNYSTSAYDPIVTPRWTPGKKEMQLVLRTEIPGLDIYYTFDNTWPDKFLDQYLGEALEIPKDADTFRAVAYKNGKKVGTTTSFSINNLYDRLPAPMRSEERRVGKAGARTRRTRWPPYPLKKNTTADTTP